MAANLLAAEQHKQLDELVEKLTTSGHSELDPEELKKVKNICKQSDEYVRKFFHALMIQLEKEHSEIRLSCVQLSDVFFNRSHCFRDLLLGDFQYFMELTIETNADFPLPPPKSAAKALKIKTIELVHNWHEKYGDVYKKLALGYNFLKNCRKVKFQDVHARSVAEQQRVDERTIRTESQHREKVQKTLDEMTEMTNEIKTCLTQAENCLLLLLPDLDTFQIHGLKSPQIFPMENPWKKAEPCQRHVNKSKKSKTTEDSVPEVTVKQEPMDDGFNVENSSNEELSFTSNHANKETEQREHMEICQNGKSSENSIVEQYQDVKLCLSELNKGLTPASADLPKNVSMTTPILSEDHHENSNESSEFHEITSDESDEMSEEEEGGEDSMREHGINTQNYSISIDMVPSHVEVVESADNEDILNTLKDTIRLIESKFLPSIQKWLEIFSKCGADQNQIKKALDLKAALNKTKEKVSKLRVMKRPKKTSQATGNTKAEEDSDDDGDFEEVAAKEGYEAHIPEHLREEYGLVERVPKPATNPDWQMPGVSKQDEEDPTSSMSTLKHIKEKIKKENQDIWTSQQPSQTNSSQTKKSTLSDVPVVPFGMDLYHWGEKIETPLMVRYDMEHRFWTANTTDDTVDKNALASMKSRVINFVGKFEPVKWTCRAPLPNGKLCPRMDRYKCPFHGKVIPRDNVGQPSNLEDKIKVEEEEERKKADKLPEWEDPELQADIKAATGIDLARKGKGSKGKGKSKGKVRKYPGLTDVKKVSNPVRNRLERKVLNRNALSRVAGALEGIDEKKRKDKFGNSFHYVHGPRKS